MGKYTHEKWNSWRRDYREESNFSERDLRHESSIIFDRGVGEWKKFLSYRIGQDSPRSVQDGLILQYIINEK